MVSIVTLCGLESWLYPSLTLKPQLNFLHLKNGTYPLGLLWGLNDSADLHIKKYVQQCIWHNKCLVNIKYYYITFNLFMFGDKNIIT